MGTRFRPAPHSVFVAAVVLFVLALLAALLTAASAPWTGLALQAPAAGAHAWTIRVIPASPAARAIGETDVLLGLREIEGRLMPATSIAAALKNPAWAAGYEAYDQHLATLRALTRSFERGRVVAVLADSREAIVVPDPDRKLTSLGDEFWLRVLGAGVAYLTAVGLWAFRPGTAVTRYFAGSGLALSVTMLLSAVTGSRQMGFPAPLLELLDSATILAVLLFAGCAVGIVAHYPARLPVARTMPLLFLALALGLVAHLLRLGGSPAATLAPSLGLAAVSGLALFQWQWRLNRNHIRLRRGLGWFFLLNLAVSCFYVGSYTLPVLTGHTPWLPPQYAALSATALYLGAAFGVYRYSLFDLDPWIFSAWLWFLLGLLILVADAALLYILNVDSASSLAASLALVAWCWFPLRQSLMLKLSRRIRRNDFRHLVVDTLSAGFDEDAMLSPAEHWRDLLQRCFAPLRIQDEPVGPRDATLADGGARLLLPRLAEAPACSLTYADRGNRLFGPKDQRLAQLLVELFDQATMARLAAVRGARQERLRLARDLHDDVIPPILSFIYRCEGSDSADRARQLLRELRRTVQTLSLEDGTA